jgi:Core-2/I-Branching enzyme
MTQVVYLIIAHTNPEQVLRLARTIVASSETAQVVVCQDRHSTAPAPALLRLPRVRTIVAPFVAAWGAFSLVQLLLFAFNWAAEQLEFEWLVLLSGQDYPLMPLAQIEDELALSPYDGYVRAVPIDGAVPCGPNQCRIVAGTAGCGECLRRYRYHFTTLPLNPLVGRDPVRRWRRVFRRINRAQPHLYLRLGRQQASTPFNASLRCYKGSAWFTLRRNALHRMLAAIARQPALLRYYRRTLIPDESLFQTVLWNDPALRLCADNRRYIAWRGTDADSPNILRADDVPAALASGAQFARKFDTRIDRLALDLIDEHVQVLTP